MRVFVLVLVALTLSADAEAHAFAQRYDLPVPLWLYLAGAGAAVGLSFVAVAVFFRHAPGGEGDYERLDLLKWPLAKLLAHDYVLFTVRLIFVGLYLLVIVTGYIGNQDQLRNLAPTLVWVIWWVGLMFVSALIGDVWALINPVDTIARWSGALVRLVVPEAWLSGGYPYPRWLGVWPAVICFAGFVWAELVWSAGGVPANISVMIFFYSALTWAGMVLFRRDVWLRNGEAFSIAFGLAARFSPLEARTVGDQRELNLRSYSVGLLTEKPIHPSMMVFVILLLSTVTYDGFMETPAWVAILGWVSEAMWLRPALLWVQDQGIGLLTFIKSVALLAAPLVFLIAFLIFARLMAFAAKTSAGEAGRSTMAVACLFVLYLMPIAIAYHLAHYLSFVLLAGQLIIPLASDPFGYGWDMFGTAGYSMNIAIINARFVWLTSVITIVTGHMIAVYLSHVAALRVFHSPAAAMRSQYPMLVLMICYTMISLWILAQPVVEAA
jgi:hypothetical protein